jgi:tetratricopeptide (TPR) repeat protein
MGGRPEEAIEPAEKAMRLDPMNTDRYWWLAGIAYLGMGRWEDAAAVAEKVLKVNPEFTPCADNTCVGLCSSRPYRNTKTRMAHPN